MIIDADELKRRYQKRIAGVRDGKVYIGPEVVTLQINNTCNLRCKFCWTHAPGNQAHFDKQLAFPWEKFVGIIGDSVDLQVNEIHITGSGEPSMHPSFREMLRYLENKPFYVKLLTNATFPIDYCDDVIKGDHIIIDLSAADRQRYRQVQGNDLFDRVVANIKRLVTLRDILKPSFHIEICYVLNAENIDQSEQMKELTRQLGVNSLYFEKMNVHDFNRDIALSEDPKIELSGEDRRTPPQCLHGWFFIIFKPENVVSTCCRIRSMHLGDFDKMSFKEMWLSTHMMNVRMMGKHGIIQKRNKPCQTCPFYGKNIKRMQDALGLEKNEQAFI